MVQVNDLLVFYSCFHVSFFSGRFAFFCFNVSPIPRLSSCLTESRIIVRECKALNNGICGAITQYPYCSELFMIRNNDSFSVLCSFQRQHLIKTVCYVYTFEDLRWEAEGLSFYHLSPKTILNMGYNLVQAPSLILLLVSFKSCAMCKLSGWLEAYHPWLYLPRCYNLSNQVRLIWENCLMAMRKHAALWKITSVLLYLGMFQCSIKHCCQAIMTTIKWWEVYISAQLVMYKLILRIIVY